MICRSKTNTNKEKRKMDMKKIVALVMASGMAVAAMADVYPTNSVMFDTSIQAAVMGDTNRIHMYGAVFLTTEEQKALDTKIFETRKCHDVIFITAPETGKILPKAAKIFSDRIKSECPHYAREIEDIASGMYVDYKPEFVLDALTERCVIYGKPIKDFCDTYSKQAIKFATKEVRRQLRKEGLPIVVVGGRDFAKERLDDLTKSLNAPRMVGVKDALAKCGIAITVVPDFVNIQTKDSEEIKKLMDDIYFGDVPFAKYKDMLRYVLGVEEYNKFVTKYNSGM